MSWQGFMAGFGLALTLIALVLLLRPKLVDESDSTVGALGCGAILLIFGASIMGAVIW